MGRKEEMKEGGGGRKEGRMNRWMDHGREVREISKCISSYISI